MKKNGGEKRNPTPRRSGPRTGKSAARKPEPSGNRSGALALDEIVRNTVDAVIVTEPNGRIIYVNPAFERMSGFSLSELTGRVPEEMIVADDPRRLGEEIRSTVRDRGEWSGELTCRRKAGEEYPIETRVFALRDGKDRLVRIAAIQQDISERKQAERAFQEREKGFREQNARLLALISGGTWYKKNLKQAVAGNLETCSEFIRTERISVWLYNRDYTRLRCFDLFERSRGGHSEGEELNSGGFPSYTNSHVRGRAIAAEDVLADPRTRDVPAAYYRKHDVRSLLDSPIWIHGRIGGLLSFEQVGSPRSWSPDDERIATTMSALLALCFEREERRQTEEALQASKDFLDHVFDSIQDGLSVLNTDLTIRHANRMMNEWYRPNLPLEGKKCYRAYHNADRPCDPCPTLRSLRSGRTEREVVPGLPGSAAEWIELFSYPIKDPETGKVTGVVEFVRDITERQRFEQVLRLHSQLLDSVRESVVAADLDGRVTYWSRGAEKLYGYTPEEVLGKPYRDFAGPVDPPNEAAFRAKIIKDGSWQGEHLQKNRGGRTFWTSTLISLVTDSRRRPTGFIGIDRDISHLKHAEEEREKLREELYQAHKMESVGRLAGGVAHDFNNMLQTIIGNAELASGRVTPESPVGEHLQEILSAARHSAELTGQLLTFARKQVTRPEIIDLNKTVASMAGVLRRLIRENVTLSWKPGRGAGRVEFDPGQLNQVLANLVVNARDAIRESGEIIISTEKILCDSKLCRAHPGSRPGEHALLSVADNGRGMNREELNRLFDPFFTTKEVGKGTGLGLATVYGIVRQNNGFIEVESEPGRGTVFRIYLPSRRIEEKDKNDVETADRKTGPSREEGATVLLVEDEPALLKLCRKFLEEEGYRVLAAAHSKEAIKLADEHPGQIDLLVTDVVMPGLSGPELWRRLAGGRPGLKRIFISGYADASDIRREISREGVRLLRKPFALGELKSRVAEVLAGGITRKNA